MNEEFDIKISKLTSHAHFKRFVLRVYFFDVLERKGLHLENPILSQSYKIIKLSNFQDCDSRGRLLIGSIDFFQRGSHAGISFHASTGFISRAGLSYCCV